MCEKAFHCGLYWPVDSHEMDYLTPRYSCNTDSILQLLDKIKKSHHNAFLILWGPLSEGRFLHDDSPL